MSEGLILVTYHEEYSDSDVIIYHLLSMTSNVNLMDSHSS